MYYTIKLGNNRDSAQTVQIHRLIHTFVVPKPKHTDTKEDLGKTVLILSEPSLGV